MEGTKFQTDSTLCDTGRVYTVLYSTHATIIAFFSCIVEIFSDGTRSKICYSNIVPLQKFISIETFSHTDVCVPPLLFDGIRNCAEQCKQARTAPQGTVLYWM